jgi:hypothetical protein
VRNKLINKIGFLSAFLLSPVVLADQPPSGPPANCPLKAAEATVTCLGSVRGLLSPSPVDKALGAAAAPECLRQAYNAASCYAAQQQASRPGERR